jgi:hypothetical protein
MQKETKTSTSCTTIRCSLFGREVSDCCCLLVAHHCSFTAASRRVSGESSRLRRLQLLTATGVKKLGWVGTVLYVTGNHFVMFMPSTDTPFCNKIFGISVADVLPPPFLQFLSNQGKTSTKKKADLLSFKTMCRSSNSV